MRTTNWAIITAFALVLASCSEAPPPAPEIRPVRAVTVERKVGGDPVSMTGTVRAEEHVALAFRLDGRLLERKVNVGDRVEPGQAVARIDPVVQQNTLQSAKANLSAAQGQVTQARNNFQRQDELMAKGFATRAQFDQAQQAQQTAQAQVDSAEAQLRTAQEQLSYTDLRADAAGVVTQTGALPGEVVRAGQMVVQIARQGGRDAVFDVPAQMIRNAPRDPVVEISLTDDPSIKTTGRVREVAPQADPVTRTFQVKVGLIDPPESMRLGATVVGRVRLAVAEAIEIPATALTETNSRPAVWVFDPATQTVSLRNVDVMRFDRATVVISQGLAAGEVVVTAGVQALHPGQKVRLLGAGAAS